MPLSAFSRRELLNNGAKLSLASLGILIGLSGKVKAEGGKTGVAESPPVSAHDVHALNKGVRDMDILNGILGMEHKVINTYQICVDGGLFLKGTIRAALIFQDHHKKHRDILIERITNLGGKPVTPLNPGEYKDALKDTPLANEKDALHLIVQLESDAANIYIGAFPSGADPELDKLASRIVADDVMHWTIMSGVLHYPLPTEALSFGV